MRCEEGKQKILTGIIHTSRIVTGYFYLFLNFGKFLKIRVLCIFFQTEWKFCH